MPVPFCLAAMLLRLAGHWRTFHRAEVVVVMDEGGFAHTVTGPDLTRRMFSGRRCVFVSLESVWPYNRAIAAMWPDVRLLFFSLNPRLGKRVVHLRAWASQRLRDAVSALACWVIRRMAPAAARVVALPELQRMLAAAAPSAVGNLHDSLRWPMAYFALQRDVMAPPLRLPDHLRNGVLASLDRVEGGAVPVGEMRRCCLYLRQKGAGSPDITSTRRVGSPVEDYRPALWCLVTHGYQVLVVGDVPVPGAIAREFHGMVLDAVALGVEAEVFDLYAATEADIAIGEAGGGLWLPVLNRIPTLIVNAFPYYLAFPGAWVHYKTARDSGGRLVHYSKLFADHAYDYELPGMTVHNNSPDEIRAAVACFLEDVGNPSAWERAATVVETLGAHTWLRLADARLSRAWLALFDGEESGSPAVSRWT